VILSTLLLLSHLKSKYSISAEKCILSAGPVHLLFHLTYCIATKSHLYLLILMFLFSINLNYIDSWHKFQTVHISIFVVLVVQRNVYQSISVICTILKLLVLAWERLLTFLYVMMVHVILIPAQYM
jgi:hypothetical protein